MVPQSESFSFRKEGPQGVLNISPAWFEQGHEVRHSITQNIYFRQLISIETVQISPQVGKVLRQTHGSDWLDCISQSNSILSAILAVIHLELYVTSQETFNRLRQHLGI
jgi:hypothetical protein